MAQKREIKEALRQINLHKLALSNLEASQKFRRNPNFQTPTKRGQKAHQIHSQNGPKSSNPEKMEIETPVKSQNS